MPLTRRCLRDPLWPPCLCGESNRRVMSETEEPHRERPAGRSGLTTRPDRVRLQIIGRPLAGHSFLEPTNVPLPRPARGACPVPVRHRAHRPDAGLVPPHPRPHLRLRRVRPRALGGVRWLEGEAGLHQARARQRTTPPGRALVRYDAASGRREVWVPAARLVPPATRAAGGRGLRLVARRQAAADLHQHPPVWRQNTRGDYWALDLATGSSASSGGPTPSRPPSCSPSSRPTAAGSPTCGRTTCTSRTSPTARITALTSDGSRTIINGTFDWVYEEELELYATACAGARTAGASPTGSSTPRGCSDFDLINNTDSLYSVRHPGPVPQGGRAPTPPRASAS